MFDSGDMIQNMVMVESKMALLRWLHFWKCSFTLTSSHLQI